jgi:hypothetical protein
MVARLQRFVEPFSSGTGFSCLDALFAFVISGAVTGVREEVNFTRRYPRTERVCREGQILQGYFQLKKTYQQQKLMTQKGGTRSDGLKNEN